MHWVKRFIGILLMLLGVIGLLACGAGVVQVWKMQTQVDEVIVGVSGKADDLLGTAQQHSQQAYTSLSSTRDSLHQLNKRVQTRIAELQDVPVGDAAGIDELERRFYARMDQAKDWIAFMQVSVDLLGQVLDMIEASSQFMQRDSTTIRDLVAATRSGYAEVEQATQLFDEMNVHLVEIQAKRNIEEHAKSFQSVYSAIDGSLVKVQGYVESFESGIAQARLEISDQVEQLRQWIFSGAMMLTFILVWFLVAQASLAIHGWKLVRTKAPVVV